MASMIKDKTTFSAVVGIGGVKKVIAKAVIRDIKFCDTKEEAMDWLAEQQ